MGKNSEQNSGKKLEDIGKKLEDIQSVLNTKVAFYEKAFFAFILALLFVGAVLVILQNYCNININDISSMCFEWISQFIGFGKESSQNGTRRFYDILNKLNKDELTSIQENFKEFFKADNKDTMYWYYRISGYESSLKQSANLGNPFAQYELANKEEYQDKRDDLLKKSMIGLEELAEQNDPYACLLLSHIYKTNIAVNKNIDKANRYELKARSIFKEQFKSEYYASKTYWDIFVEIPKMYKKYKNGDAHESQNDFMEAYEDYEKEDFQASLNGFLKVVDYENSDIDMNAKNLAKKFICFLYTQGLVTKEGLEGRIKDWMNGNDKINLTINPPEFNNNILIPKECSEEIDKWYDLLCEQFGTPKDDLQILKSSNNITVDNITVEDREYLEKKAKYGNIKANFILYILYKRNGDTKNSQRYLQDTKKYIKKCNKENNSNIKKDNKDKLEIFKILCKQEIDAKQIDQEHCVFWNSKLENRLNNAINSTDFKGVANEIEGLQCKYIDINMEQSKEHFQKAINWYGDNNETGKYNYELGKCYYEIIEEELKAPYQHLLDKKRKDIIITIYYTNDSDKLAKFYSELKTNNFLNTYKGIIYTNNINNNEFNDYLQKCQRCLDDFLKNNPNDKKKEANANNMLGDLYFYYKVQEILVVFDRSQNTPLNNEILDNVYYNTVAEKLKKYTNEAINLYTEASENNNPEAIEKLKRYYSYRNKTAEYNNWEEKSKKISADDTFQAKRCRKINREINDLDNPFKEIYRLKNMDTE